MTSNENHFVNLDQKHQRTIVIGGNNFHGSKGKGTIADTTQYGKVKKINETILVPALKKNFFFCWKNDKEKLLSKF